MRERGLIQEASNLPQVGGVVRLMRHVLIGVLFIEGTGAILLSFKFCPEMGLGRGIWNAVFHSVSAFCNAGFDLMGRFEAFSSLTRYENDVYVNVIIMMLIIVGGVGFFVWEDIQTNKWRISKYKLHTKIVLVATACLILIPAVLFFIFERNASMADYNFGESVLASLFHSVTLRTAGFNTIDVSSITASTVLLSCMLMLIGGSPGSTAGGIKTTSFAVILLGTFAHIRRKKSITVFNRRLDDDVFRKATSTLFIYLMLVCVATMAICCIESTALDATLFEVFSAIGTVGVSTGITTAIGTASKLILVFLMFLGRIGGLSLVFALGSPTATVQSQMPVERISIG